MEAIVLGSTLLLLILTGFYAWFTYRLLHHLRQEHHHYRQILDTQLKIASMPHLYCDMQGGSDRTFTLELYNVGNLPAYDVLVGVIATYTEESLDIPTLMRSYIQPRYRKYPLKVDKVGYYGIRSTARCPMLPFQKKLAIALTVPVRPVDVYALVQYREILGENYYQVYCFSELDDQGNYRANILEPTRFEALERLHFSDMDDASLPGEKTSPYAVVDFVELWNHAISYRFTTAYTEAPPLSPSAGEVEG